MTLVPCELIWLRQLLQKLGRENINQMKLICDDQDTLHIASNLVFHERTKHIKIDCHFVRQKIEPKCITIIYVNSNDQLADVFTMALKKPRIEYICNNLRAYDLYAPT